MNSFESLKPVDETILTGEDYSKILRNTAKQYILKINPDENLLFDYNDILKGSLIEYNISRKMPGFKSLMKPSVVVENTLRNLFMFPDYYKRHKKMLKDANEHWDSLYDINDYYDLYGIVPYLMNKGKATKATKTKKKSSKKSTKKRSTKKRSTKKRSTKKRSTKK